MFLLPYLLCYLLMTFLPDTHAFRNIVSSLTVTTSGGDFQISSEAPIIMANRQIDTSPALFLNSTQTDNCKLSALTRKLNESWQGSQHPSTSRLAELTLGVFAVLKLGYPDSFSLFNRILESTVPVDVSHYTVYPTEAESGVSPGQFAGFRFGAVQNLSLQYRSKRANSDYYDLVRERLCHRHGMESPIYKRAVISFIDLSWQAPSMRAIPSELFKRVLLDYYQELSTYYTECMWQDLDDRQSVGAAAGFEAFNVPSIKQGPGVVSVTVYLNQTSHRWDGYVVPWEHGIFSNFWSGKPQIIKVLEDYQGDLKFPTSPTLSKVARYGVRARRAACRSEFAEALLNYTIALEMLFSEKNQTSQAISRRLAVLISDPNPTSYIMSKKKVLSLYDARSQYVHAGSQPAQETVEAMMSIFEKALAVLVRLERRQVLHTNDSFARWTRMLDWIASG